MDFPVAGVTVSPLVPFGWALFTGVVFSMVGAAGGILAAVGHISVLGIPDANTIKPMTQVITMVTPLFSVPAYRRQRRIVVPLALLLGAGGVGGALAGSWLSTRYLHDLDTYRSLFGLATFLAVGRLLWELRPGYRSSLKTLARSIEAFEAAVVKLRTEGRLGELNRLGVRTIERGVLRVRFLFCGETFGFNVWLSVAAGFVVALVSSALGVGGGFLLVPFMISALKFPTFVVAGTSALAILLSSTTSVASYLGLGSLIDWPLMGIEIAGVAVGSLVGPYVSTFMKDVWLRWVLASVMIYIGFGYTFGGIVHAWLGFRIV